MANATWDAATVTAVTLSGGNLTTTSTGTTSPDQGARVATISAKTSGKYYFEIAIVSMRLGNNCGMGIGTTVSTYTGMGGTPTDGVMIYPLTGNIYTTGGVNTSFTLGARANGDVIGVAIDLDNRRIWYRVSPAGNWNGNATHNPATNIGGSTVPAGTMVPFITYGGGSGAAGYVDTANFGDIAFSGTTPSGYTVGWPAAATVITQGARVMVLA